MSPFALPTDRSTLAETLKWQRDRKTAAVFAQLHRVTGDFRRPSSEVIRALAETRNRLYPDAHLSGFDPTETYHLEDAIRLFATAIHALNREGRTGYTYRSPLWHRRVVKHLETLLGWRLEKAAEAVARLLDESPRIFVAVEFRQAFRSEFSAVVDQLDQLKPKLHRHCRPQDAAVHDVMVQVATLLGSVVDALADPLPSFAAKCDDLLNQCCARLEAVIANQTGQGRSGRHKLGAEDDLYGDADDEIDPYSR